MCRLWGQRKPEPDTTIASSLRQSLTVRQTNCRAKTFGSQELAMTVIAYDGALVSAGLCYVSWLFVWTQLRIRDSIRGQSTFGNSVGQSRILDWHSNVSNWKSIKQSIKQSKRRIMWTHSKAKDGDWSMYKSIIQSIYNRKTLNIRWRVVIWS